MTECNICTNAFQPGLYAKVLNNNKDEGMCRGCYEHNAVVNFQDSLLLFLSNRTDKAWKISNPLTRNEIKLEKLTEGGKPFLGTCEWDAVGWAWFLVRGVYHGAIALLTEFVLETGIWIYETASNNSGGAAYTKDFREGNVSHRLTPLFVEYYGMLYNPELKPTLEGRIFNWIRTGVSSLIFRN